MTDRVTLDRAALTELEPVLRRAAGLDPDAVVRLQLRPGSATVLARLPFGVLVSRTVDVGVGVGVDEALDVDGTASAAGAGADAGRGSDVTVQAAQTLDWLAGTRVDPPDRRDADWRGGTPPRTGWRRLDTVPDDVIRGLVRSGALALQDAAAREGVPGAQPRAEVTDALLDSVVLTVDDPAGRPTEVVLRTLSALTRMGFLPRGGSAGIDVAGRWTRVAAGYGSVYAERVGATLTVR